MVHAYTTARVDARRMAGRLGRSALRDIKSALDEFAQRLAARVASLPAGARGADILLQQQLVQRAARNLEQLLATTIREHRQASFDEIQTAWQDATLTKLKAVGITDVALVGFVKDPPITLLGAYERVGGPKTWQTLIHGYVRDAAAEADHIIRTALLEGTSPQQLAYQLRPYLQGAEKFYDAFGPLSSIDLRKLTLPGLEDAAGELSFNANRIGFTEIHAARAEAEVTSFAADPFVESVEWDLAPDRGKDTQPDECDVFAETDFFGLGAGIFPCDEVPVPPHPWDRCERVPVTRGSDEMDDPKPQPDREVDPADVDIPRAGDLTKVEADNIRQRVADNFAATARAHEGLSSLMADAVE